VAEPIAREELLRLYDEARAAWPGIDVTFDRFVERLERSQSLPAGDGASERACDLYLACACEEWNASALEQFDRRYLDIVEEAVARIDGSADFVAEVRQMLRERILVGPDAKIREYRGGGSLRGWVRTVALRTALNLRRAVQKNVPLLQSSSQLAELLDPALVIVQERHQEEIQAALKSALDKLDSDERLLLRFYYVDRLTLSQIARLHDVSISTVFRRMEGATGGVLDRVRQEIGKRLQLSTESLDSLLNNIHISLSGSLTQLLAG
jgi:RNA polymerase sigma-70 factor, ECF subfamily